MNEKAASRSGRLAPIAYPNSHGSFDRFFVAIVFCAMSAQSLMTFGGAGEELCARAVDTPEWA